MLKIFKHSSPHDIAKEACEHEYDRFGDILTERPGAMPGALCLLDSCGSHLASVGILVLLGAFNRLHQVKAATFYQAI